MPNPSFLLSSVYICIARSLARVGQVSHCAFSLLESCRQRTSTSALSISDERADKTWGLPVLISRFSASVSCHRHCAETGSIRRWLGEESRQSRQALHRQDPTIGEGRPSGLPLLPHSLSLIFRSCSTEQDPPGFTARKGRQGVNVVRYVPGHPSPSRLLGQPGCRRSPCTDSSLL